MDLAVYIVDVGGDRNDTRRASTRGILVAWGFGKTTPYTDRTPGRDRVALAISTPPMTEC